jgi:hypothetical protein
VFINRHSLWFWICGIHEFKKNLRTHCKKSKELSWKNKFLVCFVPIWVISRIMLRQIDTSTFKLWNERFKEPHVGLPKIIYPKEFKKKKTTSEFRFPDNAIALEIRKLGNPIVSTSFMMKMIEYTTDRIGTKMAEPTVDMVMTAVGDNQYHNHRPIGVEPVLVRTGRGYWYYLSLVLLGFFFFKIFKMYFKKILISQRHRHKEKKTIASLEPLKNQLLLVENQHTVWLWRCNKRSLTLKTLDVRVKAKKNTLRLCVFKGYKKIWKLKSVKINSWKIINRNHQSH